MSYEPNPGAKDPAGHAAYDGKSAEPKFASLTAGLLARKGEAEPALEPFTHARAAAASARQMAPGERHDIDRKSETPPPRAVTIEDAPRLKPRLPAAPADVEPRRFAENCPREKIATSARRAAVTFRMSVHDFLRLKLGAAELEVSSQDIIIEAIDAYLDAQGVERLDDCKCLRLAADACGARSSADL